MQFNHRNYSQTGEQRQMWQHFEKCAALVRDARKGKRLIIVHDGDAIEGVHHGSPQIITPSEYEQIDIHIEIMDHFLKLVRFKSGSDALYYVTGTECHTNDGEHIIAKDLGAEMNREATKDHNPDPDLTPQLKERSVYTFDELYLMVNGRLLWFVHHGPSAGKGANMGNALRNWLKNIFYEQLHEGERPPDMVITGHTHNDYYTPDVRRYNGGYHITHGLIVPAWQKKTRFANQVAPVSKNRIGLAYFGVSAAGDIRVPEIPVMEQERKSIKV